MENASGNNPEPIEDVSTLKQKIRELEQSAAESRRVEETLRESEARFRFLAENATDIIWMVGMDNFAAHDNRCRWHRYGGKDQKIIQERDFNPGVV